MSKFWWNSWILYKCKYYGKDICTDKEYDNIDFLKNIYTYSFALFPEKIAPSGTCNMSKFANITLYLDYSDIIHGDMLLRVYSINYNIFISI